MAFYISSQPLTN